MKNTLLTMPDSDLPPLRLPIRLHRLRLVWLVMLGVALMLAAPAAWAQAFCASDGQPQQLVERFINAQCGTCWQDPATPPAGADQAVLDWIVPYDAGSQGDDAPLAAVANRDGLVRLEALGKSVPLTGWLNQRKVKSVQTAQLRVAHGLVLSGYLGVSIELHMAPPAAELHDASAWLVLVQAVAPGTEGTPVQRHLVRNMVQIKLGSIETLPTTGQRRFFESRVMSVAAGINPADLRVVGWVEDANGNVLAAAQSRCAPP